MNRRTNKLSLVLFLELILFVSILILPFCGSVQETILLDASPAEIKHLQLPFKSGYDVGYSNKDYRIKVKDRGLLKRPIIPADKYFQIEPSDAIDGTKYSQPALDYRQLDSYQNQKVPSTTTLKDKLSTFHTLYPSHKISTEQNLSPLSTPNSSSKPLRDLRFLEGISSKNPLIAESFSGKENVTAENELNMPLADSPANENLSSEYFEKNNFTDSSSNLLSVSSETVLSYENPSSNFEKDVSRFVVPVKKNSEHAAEKIVPSHTENPKPIYTGTNLSTLFPALPKMATESSVVLSTHLYIELINQTYSTESSVTTTVLSSIDYDLENISSSSPSFDNQSLKLSPGVIAGVVIGVLVCVTLLSSAVIYLLYRRYNGKCTSVVEGKFNSDNCGYLDDSLRSSIYLNNHIELPKESSEEMSSLDNDSFLNSLETMTIQNYWADNSKNTKV
ncbi:uncharacterized protein LOC129960636 [Argiope bruennichi]|uniref:Uncharacterized protein n=1 Tax=Argiope bruennichi TaxID=94029 RepID=A0A8T0FL85_ARGBR|nr:uncharacterized protein LOC129960636 [Argiope bruennichi]KAF8791242.1 hypothetical protein HNY73_006137 [Argiope bruennichi]